MGPWGGLHQNMLINYIVALKTTVKLLYDVIYYYKQYIV